MLGSPEDRSGLRAAGMACSEPAPHAKAIATVLLAKAMIKIPFLPGNDAVANNEQRWQNGKEHPRGIEDERQSANHQRLTQIVGIAAEPIRARDHQMVTCAPRGDGCARPPKVTYHGDTERKADNDEETARDTGGVDVDEERARPEDLENQTESHSSKKDERRRCEDARKIGSIGGPGACNGH